MSTLNTIIWLPEILMIHCICYTLDSNDNFLRRQRYFEVLNVRIFESQTYQRRQDSGSSFTWNYSLLGVEKNTKYKLDHLILVEAWRLQYTSSMAKIRNANDLNGCDYKQISTYRIRSRAWDSCSSTGSSSKKKLESRQFLLYFLRRLRSIFTVTYGLNSCHQTGMLYRDID